MNPDWVHEPNCDEWGFERTYLNDECLICLLIIKVRRNALVDAHNAVDAEFPPERYPSENAGMKAAIDGLRTERQGGQR